MTMRIVTAIADALADPERVAAVTTRPGNELVLSGRPMRQWQPVGLSDAHPAVSLLFAELGAADPAQWPRAHAHLAAALAAPASSPRRPGASAGSSARRWGRCGRSCSASRG
ncbi:hypothetical protein, partial [Actinomadura fibrosa]|uniref:hypothetical protein n=1 Tax=Actinomadura fibrosa TaxID=111802 RepID=UPI001A956192